MAKFKVGDEVNVSLENALRGQLGAHGIGLCFWDKRTHTIKTIVFENAIGTTYQLVGSPFFWPEDGLVLANQSRVREFIVIRRDGQKTIAELRHDKEVVKTGVAHCNPADKFDFQYGAMLAFLRLVKS